MLPSECEYTVFAIELVSTTCSLRWKMPINGYFMKVKPSVEDPYCGLRPHRPRLFQLLTDIAPRLAALDKLVVICREPYFKDLNYESRTAMQSALATGLQAAGCPEDRTTIRILDYRAGKKLHDRSLRAKVITADGSSQTLIYDLSGGIDYLMDVTRETKVYAYVREE